MALKSTEIFRKNSSFLRWEVASPHQTSSCNDHLSSAVPQCYQCSHLHILQTSATSAIRARATPYRHGECLISIMNCNFANSVQVLATASPIQTRYTSLLQLLRYKPGTGPCYGFSDTNSVQVLATASPIQIRYRSLLQLLRYRVAVN